MFPETSCAMVVPISYALVDDILFNAVPRGINYWCDGGLERKETGDGFTTPKLPYYEVRDGDGVMFVVDRATIIQGMTRLFAGPVRGLHESRRTALVGQLCWQPESEITIDPEEADWIVQAAVFSEMIYG